MVAKRDLRIPILALFLIWSSLVFSQSGTPLQSQLPDKTDCVFSDSLVDANLKNLYPNPLVDVLGNGRSFKYLSFRVPFLNGKDTLKVFNFGENSTHRPCLMLLALVSGSKVMNQQILGFHGVDDDMKTLTGRQSMLNAVNDKLKIEILDIWIQVRKGIIVTERHIH